MHIKTEEIVKGGEILFDSTVSVVLWNNNPMFSYSPYYVLKHTNMSHSVSVPNCDIPTLPLHSSPFHATF